MRRLFLRQGQRSGSFDHVLWQFAAAAGEDDHGVSTFCEMCGEGDSEEAVAACDHDFPWG